MRRRDATRARARALIDALNAVADALRSGASLRQALGGATREPSSPFHPVATALEAGHPLAPTLHAATAGEDADLASACCVLAVHAETGGDPLPACRALADRVARRQASRDEARALTTQARLGARTILLLTPAFLLLVGASDPRGLADWFADPRTRVAIVSGLLLQALGGWWISSIVGAASGSPSFASRVPLLRAVRALLVGRPAPTGDEQVASCAEIVALVLAAGVSTTSALSSVARFARGPFGDALRTAIGRPEVPVSDALHDAVATLELPSAERFARSVAASTELGVPLAPSLRVLADDLRDHAGLRLAEDIRRASIRVLVPLGALVLPAFVLACLVPLFVGGLDGLAG